MMLGPGGVVVWSWLILGPCVGALAADPYETTLDNFMSPAPRKHLRELSTDRPDKTESPSSVDAGHVQVDLDMVSWTRDRRTPDGSHVVEDGLAYGVVNLKLGLTSFADLQLVFPSYTYEDARSSRADGGSRGLG